MKAIDKLVEKILEKNNKTVMGLDAKYEMLPDSIKSKYGTDCEGQANAILEFNKRLIDTTFDIIPAVKPQIAFYEIYGANGIKVYEETCKYAKSKGLVVISDAKRGDIGSTATAYSTAFLGKDRFDVDFVTVNPYLGIDGIKPFIEDCTKNEKGIFILVKTSNPSSGELQDLKLENGKTVYMQVAELVEKWGEDLRGKYGYSSIAAVVGATYPSQLEEIRKNAPHTFFLIPGYGAQGGKAEDIALGFDEKGIRRNCKCFEKLDVCL